MNHEEQKKHARDMSIKNGVGTFLEKAKEWYVEQRDVANEYKEGKKGPATEKAEKKGKNYHPFTGLTY